MLEQCLAMAKIDNGQIQPLTLSKNSKFSNFPEITLYLYVISYVNKEKSGWGVQPGDEPNKIRFSSKLDPNTSF